MKARHISHIIAIMFSISKYDFKFLTAIRCRARVVHYLPNRLGLYIIESETNLSQGHIFRFHYIYVVVLFF